MADNHKVEQVTQYTVTKSNPPTAGVAEPGEGGMTKEKKQGKEKKKKKNEKQKGEVVVLYLGEIYLVHVLLIPKTQGKAQETTTAIRRNVWRHCERLLLISKRDTQLQGHFFPFDNVKKERKKKRPTTNKIVCLLTFKRPVSHLHALGYPHQNKML